MQIFDIDYRTTPFLTNVAHFKENKLSYTKKKATQFTFVADFRVSFFVLKNKTIQISLFALFENDS